MAKQLYPQNSRYVQDAYATREPYGYLLLDLQSEQDKDLRLRMQIFPANDRSCTCWKDNIQISLKVMFLLKTCQFEEHVESESTADTSISAVLREIVHMKENTRCAYRKDCDQLIECSSKCV